MQQDHPILQRMTTLKVEFIIRIKFNLPRILCLILFGEHVLLFLFHTALRLPRRDQTHRYLCFFTIELRYLPETQGGQTQPNSPISPNETLVPAEQNPYEYNPALPPAS